MTSQSNRKERKLHLIDRVNKTQLFQRESSRSKKSSKSESLLENVIVRHLLDA